MLINVKYFGMIAEITKRSNEQLEVMETATVEKVRKQLIKKYPEMKRMKYKFAINQEFVEKETLIAPNDELAILPPFAGG